MSLYEIFQNRYIEGLTQDQVIQNMIAFHKNMNPAKLYVTRNTTVDNKVNIDGKITSRDNDFALIGDENSGKCGNCRALVKSGGPPTNNKLILNYANDFKGGVNINGPTNVKGPLHATRFTVPIENITVTNIPNTASRCRTIGKNKLAYSLTCEDGEYLNYIHESDDFPYTLDGICCKFNWK